MHRRGFLRLFGIGAAASVVGTQAVAAVPVHRLRERTMGRVTHSVSDDLLKAQMEIDARRSRALARLNHKEISVGHVVEPSERIVGDVVGDHGHRMIVRTDGRTTTIAEWLRDLETA